MTVILGKTETMVEEFKTEEDLVEDPVPDEMEEDLDPVPDETEEDLVEGPMPDET